MCKNTEPDYPIIRMYAEDGRAHVHIAAPGEQAANISTVSEIVGFLSWYGLKRVTIRGGELYTHDLKPLVLLFEQVGYIDIVTDNREE